MEKALNLSKSPTQTNRSSQAGFKTLEYRRDTINNDREEVQKYFASYFDIQLYPPTPDEKVLHWTYFTRDFWSKDLPATEEETQTC